MPVKADAAIEQLEVGMCDRGIEHVFIDVVARAGMNQQHVMFKMAVWQPPQPRQPLLSNHLNCPTNDRRGVVIEPFEDFRIGAGSIVVSDQRQPVAFHDLIDATLGIAPVTYNVTETEHFVDRWAVTQNGLQRLPVGVDVRNNRDFQAGLS